MRQERKNRSGKAFFFAAVGLVFSGILATVLLANDHRNLDLLLSYLGYPHLLPKHADPPKRATIRHSKALRLPPARMVLPVYAFADMKAPEQHFIRLIQSDPKSLCERLKDGGFGGMDWTVSSASEGNWECSSFIDLPAEPKSETRQSSVFVNIKGDSENRVTSFRVKLNIENAADRKNVTDLGATAANIFLQQVRWDDGGDIIARIHALEAFDIRNFGSRIQFKREFGDTPRYNFLANQTTGPGRETLQVLFFDRTRWFPLTDSDGTPMIDGMMAGESAQGLTLPDKPTP